MAGRIAVVDAENRFLRWEERHTIHEERLVHRSIAVLLFDTAGRLLIQRRHRNKQTFPGYWDISCAGHVEESDYTGPPDADLAQVYQQVALREVEEELGVEAQLSFLGHFPPLAGVHYEHIHLFLARHDGPFTAQETEVEELQRLARPELEALLQDADAQLTNNLRWFGQWTLEQGLWPDA